MQACLTSEDQAFMAQLYETHMGLLFAMARRCCADHYIQEEVVQESLVHLLQHVDTLRALQPGALARYVAVTVRNTAYTFLRKGKREDQSAAPWCEEVEALSDGGPSMEDQLIQAERREDLKKMWEQLSQEDRFLLQGRYLMGYSYQTLSEGAGVSPHSVRMKMSRVRRRAQRILLEENAG